jgi:hypothetical protein
VRNREAGEPAFGNYKGSIGRLYYEVWVFQKAADVFVLLTVVRDLDGDNDDPNGGLYHALAPAGEVVTVRTHTCFGSEQPGSGAGSRARPRRVQGRGRRRRGLLRATR